MAIKGTYAKWGKVLADSAADVERMRALVARNPALQFRLDESLRADAEIQAVFKWSGKRKTAVCHWSPPTA